MLTKKQNNILTAVVIAAFLNSYPVHSMKTKHQDNNNEQPAKKRRVADNSPFEFDQKNNPNTSDKHNNNILSMYTPKKLQEQNKYSKL